MTTGHTADEIAGVLRRAGAGYVEVWVIARSGHTDTPGNYLPVNLGYTAPQS
jgi:hypothetical protein